MADEPQRVVVQASRLDDSILPPGFPLAYRLYVIQQGSDLQNVADASNNASGAAYQAELKNEEQDQRINDLNDGLTQLRIEVDLRLDSAESAIVVIQSNISSIQADMVSKSATVNQSVQAGGGSLLVGSVTSPTADKLQVAGSENVSVSYKVSGLQVVGARQTGWTAATGTSLLGVFNASQAYSTGTAYSQAELQAIAQGLVQARQRIKALEDMARTHGLIA